MRKQALLFTGLIALLTVPAFAANPADAPRQALITFADAAHAGDVKAMNDTLYIAPANKDQVATLVAMYQATAQLRQAMLAKFGDEATRAGWAGVDAALDTRKKALANAEVKIDGDHAVLTIATPSGDDNKLPREITCVKVGESWKIDAASIFALNEPKANESIARLKKMTELFNNVAKDVGNGNLGTMQAAQRALAEGAKATLDNPASTTHSATRP